jgi:hypothetical protein
MLSLAEGMSGRISDRQMRYSEDLADGQAYGSGRVVNPLTDPISE